MNAEESRKLTLRRIVIAFVPLVALIGMIVLGVTVFGRDVGDGPSQISLVFATALAAVLAGVAGRVPWSLLEQGITSSIAKAGVSIMILFLIGMLSGAWMIGGVVPTLICYGVKIMNPHLFLVCACIICAIVSLLTGTSWTTVATIGVALLGIGTALGVPAPWSAGAIISGAYFGDKLSPLSDTTILASSSTGTDLFVHIKYMLFTTIPSMTLTLIIFLVSGFFLVDASAVDVQTFSEGLSHAFHVSPWTLLVPVATGALIALRLPSLAVLFISALLGGVSAVVLQGDVLLSVVGEKLPDHVLHLDAHRYRQRGAGPSRFHARHVRHAHDRVADPLRRVVRRRHVRRRHAPDDRRCRARLRPRAGRACGRHGLHRRRHECGGRRPVHFDSHYGGHVPRRLPRERARIAAPLAHDRGLQHGHLRARAVEYVRHGAVHFSRHRDGRVSAVLLLQPHQPVHERHCGGNRLEDRPSACP